MSTDLPSAAPDPPMCQTPHLRPPWRRWIEVGVIVGIPLLLIALLLPAVQQAREAALRSQNKNNLKLIGLGLQNYQETYNALPPGGTFAADGTAYHGWMTLICPFLDASPLYNSLALNLPWDHPKNAQYLKGYPHTAFLMSYPDPMWTVEGWPLAYYAGNPDLLYRNSSVSVKEIEETSRVWIVGEVSGDLTPWPYPYNWRPMGSDLSGGHGYGRERNFSHLLFLDGSVRFVGREDVPAFLHSAELISHRIRQKRGEPTVAQTAKPNVEFTVTDHPPHPGNPMIDQKYIERFRNP